MSYAPPYLFCTQADVESRLSTDGVSLRLDDDSSGGTLSGSEVANMTEVIYEASGMILHYCWMKYDPAILAQANAPWSWWPNQRAVDYATWVLCLRRGNPAPESVNERCEETKKVLERILSADGLIPMAPVRRRFAPVWANTRVDMGYQYKCVRVEAQTSSPSQRGNVRNVDWPSVFTFEL